MSDHTKEQVLKALEVLFSANKVSSQDRRQANKWLEDFQKSNYAWGISDAIIKDQLLPVTNRIFAAQTFRQKVELDLEQLDPASTELLRQSLLGLLYEYRAGPKTMLTQLSLSLADLAIQMADWQDPVLFMIDALGANQEMVPILLEFLNVLPEEFNYNRKISMDVELFNKKSEKSKRRDIVLKSNATRVMAVIVSYLDQAQNNEAILLQVLECFTSWLRSETITLEMIQASPIIELSFAKLTNPLLFDICVDIICEVILQSSAKPRNEQVVQLLYPKLLPLVNFMKTNSEDVDIVRGITRILVEAGECYADLIASNLAAFEIIVQGLLFSAAYEELDIAKITFNFWYVLAEVIIISPDPAFKAQFFPIYKQLIGMVLKHIHYPTDLDTWTAQERDEFREYRYSMGDVLKDCVRVLGEEALSTPYSILATFFPTGPNGVVIPLDPRVTWQQIEAPLFSLRTMCSEVSTSESRYLPEIMAMLPRLPVHPKIKYAALLLTGRYAEWTNMHPAMLAFQLDFVSNGFEATNRENDSAAAQTFRDLCKYCSKHLVNFLPQLHTFYLDTIQRVHVDDRQQLTEAVSHILSVVPLINLDEAIQLFTLPLAQDMHTLCSQTIPQSQDERVKLIISIRDLLDQLSTFFKFARPVVAPEAAHPCVSVFQNMWPVITTIFKQFGNEIPIAEAIARLFRNSMETYQSHFLPLLQSLVQLLLEAYIASSHPCYLWVSGHLVRIFGSTPECQVVLKPLIENLSAHVLKQVQSMTMQQSEEIIEEYHFFLSQVIQKCPDLMIPILGSTFDCAIYCLSTPSFAVQCVLEYHVKLIALSVPTGPYSTVSSLFPGLKVPIQHLLSQRGNALVAALFTGLCYTFPRERESVGKMSEVLVGLCSIMGQQWLVEAIRHGLPAPGPHESFIIKASGYFGLTSALQDPARVGTMLNDFRTAFIRKERLK